MPDAQARCTAAKASVGNEGTLFAQVFRLDVRCGVKHFLHSRSSFGAFVGDDHHIAAHHLASQDSLASRFLRIEDFSGTGEFPDALIHSSRLHHASVLRNVTLQYRQASVFRISMLQITDTPCGTVGVQRIVHRVLRAQRDAERSARCAPVNAQRLGIGSGHTYIISGNGFRQGSSVYPAHRSVQQAPLRQLAQNVQNTTGTVHVLYVVFLRIGSHLAQARHASRKLVDVVHTEIHFRLVGNGKQVKHRVGRTAHRNVEGHGVEESLACGDAPWQYTIIPITVILPRILHDEPCRVFEQDAAVGVRSKNGAVPRQGKPDCLVQAIHRVGGEHSRAAPASGTGVTLYFRHIGIAHTRVRRLNHRVYQVEMHPAPFAGLHRSSRHEHRGDIEPHRRHQHPRRNLVAIGDANHRIRLMRVHHILDAVGDNVARRQ